MTNPKLSEKEINFLKSSYPDLGKKACEEKLNKKIPYYQIRKLGLKVSKKFLKRRNIKNVKIREKNRLNKGIELMSKFKIKTPEIAYLLGFIWGDGHVYKNQNSIIIECIYEDALYIKDIVNFCQLKNKFYTRQRQKSWKRTGLIHINELFFWMFLKNHDYDKKSIKSANKILNKIPKDLHYAFLLGLFDADGCLSYKFSFEKPRSNFHCFSIANSYEYDWGLLKNLFAEQIGNDAFFIRKKKPNKKGHKSSALEFTKFKHIQKMLLFLYQNKRLSGLPRKNKKAKNLVKDRKNYELKSKYAKKLLR